jgi:hypothetical protein
MKFLLFFISFLFIQNLSSQKGLKYKFQKTKASTSPGTFWVNWGYNRSVYSKSNINFIGEGYNFTLASASASDNQSKDFNQYVNLNTFTVPQFNLRLGLYVKPKVAISIGYDHMKYLFDDKNEVLMSGHIDQGIDSLWSGDYDNRPITTDRNHFHYENSNGLNYIRIEMMRSMMLYQTKSKAIVITANISLGTGCILTISDFNFAQKFSRYTSSLSGFGFSSHASLRFEFFKRLFVQTELSGGYLNLSKVKLRTDDSQALAKHDFWYGQRNITVGALFYFKAKNACDDCPIW